MSDVTQALLKPDSRGLSDEDGYLDLTVRRTMNRSDADRPRRTRSWQSHSLRKRGQRLTGDRPVCEHTDASSGLVDDREVTTAGARRAGLRV
jgi:hypothetical protein